jgi:hypothetical protein
LQPIQLPDVHHLPFIAVSWEARDIVAGLSSVAIEKRYVIPGGLVDWQDIVVLACIADEVGSEKQLFLGPRLLGTVE